MAVTEAELMSPLGPLRQETFRDVSVTDFTVRVSHRLGRCAETVAARAPVGTAQTDVDAAVEALALASLFEQAASIWAGLPSEESVAGEVSFKYLDPSELREEAERWFVRYNAAVAVFDESARGNRRPGRLRRV